METFYANRWLRNQPAVLMVRFPDIHGGWRT